MRMKAWCAIFVLVYYLSIAASGKEVVNRFDLQIEEAIGGNEIDYTLVEDAEIPSPEVAASLPPDDVDHVNSNVTFDAGFYSGNEDSSDAFNLPRKAVNGPAGARRMYYSNNVSHDSICSNIPCYENQTCVAYQGHPLCWNEHLYLYPDPTYDCGTESCLNGGNCVYNETKQAWKCMCRKGHHGNNCESTMNACTDPTACESGKTCIGVSGNGIRCVILPCDPRPCQNGGTCIQEGNDFMCLCTERFQGRTCGEEIDPCEPNPCGQYGTCIRFDLSYRCECEVGFSGQHCREYNPCHSSPCVNGGTCMFEGNCFNQRCDFRCVCPPRYTGRYCETRTSLCDSFPCLNGGTCIEECVGQSCSSYRCACPAGYIGENCQTPTQDPCASNPCYGSGCRCHVSCRHEFGYYCSNAQGYVGKSCEVAPPTLRCETEEINVKIPTNFAQEFTSDLTKSTVYMSNSNDPTRSERSECVARSTNDGYDFTIRLPFRNCDTRMTTRSDETSYENTVWLQKGERGYDYIQPILNFRCNYDLQYSVLTSLTPVVATSLSHISKTTRGSASISLCKKSTCGDGRCPIGYEVNGGAYYTVGERIHLNIEVEMNHLTMQADVYEAFLSCSDTISRYEEVADLINGCELNEDFDISFGQSAGSRACMSFRVPRVTRCSQVYIHLLLRVCNSSSLEYTPCYGISKPYTCGSSATRRQKRLVEDGHQVIGPVVFIHGRSGVGVMELESDEQDQKVVFRSVFGNANTEKIRIPQMIDQKPAGSFVFDIPVAALLLSGVSLMIIALIVFIFLMVVRKNSSAASEKA